MSNASQELLQKANLALTNIITDGGYLAVGQADSFIQELIDGSPVMKIARSIPMSTPLMELTAMGFGSRVVRPGAEATALSASDHAVPSFRNIPLSSKLYKAQVQMTYEVLEDNIARGSLETAVMQSFMKRVAADVEQLILQGDTTNVGDAYLATLNGVVARITSNVVNAATTGNTPQTYNNMLIALADRFKQNLSSLRFIITPAMEQNYRMSIGNRPTAYGDATIQGSAPLTIFGVQAMRANYMPAGTAVLIDPFNIIVGIQRNMRLEFDRDIEKGLIKFVLSFRMDTTLENQLAAVKATNVA